MGEAVNVRLIAGLLATLLVGALAAFVAVVAACDLPSAALVGLAFGLLGWPIQDAFRDEFMRRIEGRG